MRSAGVDITQPGVDINKVRRDVGMVFQQFNLFPHKTAPGTQCDQGGATIDHSVECGANLVVVLVGWQDKAPRERSTKVMNRKLHSPPFFLAKPFRGPHPPWC